MEVNLWLEENDAPKADSVVPIQIVSYRAFLPGTDSDSFLLKNGLLLPAKEHK